MKVLIIGGTGLISRGITKHLLEKGDKVSFFNRGNKKDFVPAGVAVIQGDRNDEGALAKAADGKYDVVMDMVCFEEKQAKAAAKVFAKKTGHFIFCSTVCAYGTYYPGRFGLKITEADELKPISGYGRGKVASEKVFMEAHGRGDFQATIMRPSCTYGPGGTLIDNLGWDTCTWDRVERGLPILCAGDGLGLWQACHRDDAGAAFAYAAGRASTFGQAYNVVHQEVMTWTAYLCGAAKALGKMPEILYLPADRIVKKDPQRFGGLQDIFRWHGAYESEKIRSVVPEFKHSISFEDGAAQTLADMKKRGNWKKSEDDPVYAELVKEAQRA